MAKTPATTVRLTTAATAVAAAAMLAAYPVAAADGSIALPLTLGLLAVATLLIGLAASQSVAIGASVALLGLELVFQPDSGHHASSGVVAVYAGGLVLVAELAFWSQTVGLLTPIRRRIARRSATTLIVALTASAVAALVNESSHASLTGAWLEPLGVAAAIAATLLVILLATNTGRQAG